MQMLNYLVRRLSVSSIKRLKNVRFGIFHNVVRMNSKFSTFSTIVGIA